jgi:predicted AAA+ superfamily ATPase
VFITGSNAKMLSSEVAGALGGRFIIREILPYSFTEYLSAAGVVPSEHWELTQMRFEIRRLFNDYFYFGGFPDTFLFEEKRLWLHDLYQKVLYGDVIARHSIRNDFALKLLVKKLAESVMADISYTRLRNIIASAGISVGTTTIIEYLSYLGESYLSFELTNWNAKFSERESSKKYYFTDNGVLSLFLLNPENRLLENLVAVELRRRGKTVYFLKDNYEADFYLPEESLMIGVTLNCDNPQTEQREVTSLLKLSEKHGAQNLMIITLDDERIVERKNRVVAIVPVVKWLVGVG